MNPIKKWLLFTSPERYFHQLSYNNRQLIRNMNLLDEKRQNLQRQIVELSCSSVICSECKGACCRGNYNHFTIIDYLIRCHSEKPVQHYGEIHAPHSLINLAGNQVKSLFTKVTGTEQLAQLTTRCPELIEGSCRLLPEDRPVRCVLWTCTEYKQKFDQKKLYEIGRLNRELKGVVRNAMKLYNSV